MAYELDAIAAVVIGGTSLSGGQGSLVGTLFGALIIGVINNGLDLLGVSSYYQQVIKGAIIVGAVWLRFAQKGKRISKVRSARFSEFFRARSSRFIRFPPEGRTTYRRLKGGDDRETHERNKSENVVNKPS